MQPARAAGRLMAAALRRSPVAFGTAFGTGYGTGFATAIRAVGARRRTGARVAGERPAAAVEHADVRRRLDSQRVDRRGRVRARDERLLWWVAPLGASRRGDEDPQHMRPGHFAIAWLRYLCQTTHQREAAP